MALGFEEQAATGFQLGRQIAGPNALGVFVKGLLDRASTLEQLRAKAGFEAQADVQKEQALGPFKVAQAGAEAKAKAEAEASADPFSNLIFGGGGSASGETSPVAGTGTPMERLGAFQKTLPQGVTVKSPSGGISITHPLPPALIQQEGLRTEDAIGSIEQLERMAAPLRGLTPGLFQGLKRGALNYVSGGTSNPALRLYLDEKTASVAGLYKALTGDRQISNTDAGQRAQPLVWRPEKGEPYDTVGAPKFQRLREAFQRRRELIANGQFMSRVPGEVYTPLSALGLEDETAQPNDFDVLE